MIEKNCILSKGPNVVGALIQTYTKQKENFHYE